MDKYHSIRAKLLEKRKELQGRLEKITRNVEDKEALAKDFAEQATERENEEVLDALELAARTELREIDKAFERMENEEYEICAGCGQTIPMERLEIVPYTELCVRCAGKRESGRQRLR